MKHAGDHVILVSIPRLQLGRQIQEFARKRGVKILYLSPRDFDPHHLRRFAIDHEVPSKGPYCQPVESALRFVEPI